MKFQYFQNAIEWFDSIGDTRKRAIKKECPDSWNGSSIDFYEWVADAYKKEIEEYVKGQEK